MASDGKRAKMGASRYRKKFNNAGTAEYPIKSVPNDIYKFYYVLLQSTFLRPSSKERCY